MALADQRYWKARLGSFAAGLCVGICRPPERRIRREDSDLGLGPNAPFLAVRSAAAIPDLVEAVAAEGHDVMIVAPKPARQAFGLSGRIGLARVGFGPPSSDPERREALGSEVSAGPGSLLSRR